MIVKISEFEDMQIAALQTLATIARESSFSRTAEIRNMTLSAVSMQIKALEDELGVQIFDRSFRPPKLTPIGQRLAQDAKAIAEAYAVMRARCAGAGALSGVVRVGFVPSTAARILPDFLEVAARRAPSVSFEMTTGLSGQLCDQVRSGRLDAAVVTDIAEATVDLTTDVLVREEMVIAAPRNAPSQDLVELSKSLPFIHFVPSSGIGKLIARYCRQMQLDPPHVLSLDSVEAIVRCVEHGLGYALLPRPDVARYGGDDVLVFSCTPDLLFRDVSLATRDDVLTRIWRPEVFGLLQEGVAKAAAA